MNNYYKNVSKRTKKTKQIEPEVTTFASGAIRDKQEGKEDYVETLSWTALKKYAQYMTGKKVRYGAGNFKKGIPIENYEQSLVRHLQTYFENKYEEGTKEVGDHHLCGVIFNAFGILHEEGMAEKRKKKSV